MHNYADGEIIKVTTHNFVSVNMANLTMADVSDSMKKFANMSLTAFSRAKQVGEIGSKNCKACRNVWKK